MAILSASCLFQTMISRDDHVSIVVLADGTRVVEHEDGTRITTFLREIESDQDTDEKQGKITSTSLSKG